MCPRWLMNPFDHRGHRGSQRLQSLHGRIDPACSLNRTERVQLATHSAWGGPCGQRSWRNRLLSAGGDEKCKYTPSLRCEITTHSTYNERCQEYTECQSS